MSASTVQRRKTSGALLPLVLVGGGLVGAAGWYTLVLREDQAAQAAMVEADRLQGEIARAQAYLRGRPQDAKSNEEVHAAAVLLQKRVPVGRADIAVAQYCQLRAADAGLADFKYDVVNGMALPLEHPEAERAPEERLVLEPLRLQSQLISMDFSARYRDFLSFQKALADAPWLLEVTSLNLKRDKDNAVVAHLTLRYLYQ